MPIESARMPLLDHMGELRRRLMIVVVSLIVAACVLYMATPTIMDFLVAPIAPYLTNTSEYTEHISEYLVTLTPLGGFSIRFRVAFFAAFVMCTPIVLWEVLAFFLPALKPSERKWVVPTVAVGVALFIIGTVFCYCIILDPAFEWMLGQTKDVAQVMPDAGEYLKLIMLFEIGFGVAFELPIIVFYLIVFNIVPYKKLRSSWRIVYIVLMLISACVTPDASPVTMLLMFAAMAGLYECSLLVSRIVLRKRIKKQGLEDTEAAQEMAQKAGIKMNAAGKSSKARKKARD